MLKVENLVSARSGRVVANQFNISRYDEAGKAVEHVFQSYESECARLENIGGNDWRLTIYSDGFFSRTTAKYLRAWLFTYLPADCIPETLKAAKTAISGGAESWTAEGRL